MIDKMEYNATIHPAGRELDSVIAQMLGLAVERSGYHDGYNYSVPMSNGGRVVLEIPRYSTDTSAAVAFLVEPDSDLSIVGFSRDRIGGWMAYPDFDMHHAATSMTLAHAICLAFLRRYAMRKGER